MKVLIIGDFHIPTRAKMLHPVIRYEIESHTYEMVFCTGDLTSPQVLKWLKGLAPQVKVVRGNMDYLALPKRELVKIFDKRIIITHGNEIRPRGNKAKLKELAIRLNANMLIHGHTHELSIDFYKNEGLLLLNPGSATGVWSGGGGSLIPSFIILEFLSTNEVVVNSYELKSGRLLRTSSIFRY